MNEHSCLHEEQIMEQSKAIERFGAELEYKKERLDELKEDNKRMEGKIDTLNTNLTNFISKSDANDTKLDLRLTKIETRQEEQEKATKNNRDDANLKIAIFGIVLLVIQIYLNWFG